METIEVRIGEWLAGAIDMYRKNFVLLLATHFVAVMLGAVTFGLLLGPMMAGLMLITLRLADSADPHPQVGDLFNGFSYFLQPLLFFLVWFGALFIAQSMLATVPGIGQLAGLVLNMVVCALLLFGIPLIVDREMDFWSASAGSYAVVSRAFWPLLAYSALGSLIASSGAILFGVGVILTMPIYTCMTALAYRAIFGVDESGENPSGRPPAIDV